MQFICVKGRRVSNMADIKRKINEPIFVVDDEKEICANLKDLIEYWGYEVYTFSNPKEALEAIPKYNPFMILSDYKMPEMTGIEFCNEVRKVHMKLPFVIVTGFADKEMAMAGFTSGLSELLEKPYSESQIKTVVEKYTNQRLHILEEERKELEEITQFFVEEASDLLSDLDQLILRLEEEEIDSVVIDSLFRKIHSVKGGAGAIPGGTHLASLSHDFESVLSLIKKGEVRPDSEAVNLFLSAGDLSMKLIHLLKEGKSPDSKFVDIVSNTIQLLKNTKTRLSEAPQKHSATTASEKKEKRQPTVAIAATQAEDNHEDEGVWVTNEKLDSFMGLSGELIVLKNYFQMVDRDQDIRQSKAKLDKKLSEFAYSLNKITDQLQQEIISVRKVTLERTFSKLPRIVRQTSQEVGKRVLFNSVGLDLGVDKNIAKSLSACMVHMIRNAVDHGIESPDTRREAGKPIEGTVTLSAAESQGIIQITVSDDGGGISKERVIKKALQNGLIDEHRAATLTDAEIYDLIFLPGFSTAEKVSNVSGRGVGMDVVKSAVVANNGRIRIESELGKGSTFLIEIPVPKAVMVEQTVLSRWGDTVFAIPLTAISRITTCNNLTISSVNGMRTCQFDNKTVPMRTYDELLEDHDKYSDELIREKSVVFIHYKNQFFALVVDAIEDQLEAVIRPFDSIVKRLPGFKGTAVLGNESISYIVSPEEIVGLMNGSVEKRAAGIKTASIAA